VFLGVVVLLNVVIAIVSAAWDSATSDVDVADDARIARLFGQHAWAVVSGFPLVGGPLKTCQRLRQERRERWVAETSRTITSLPVSRMLAEQPWERIRRRGHRSRRSMLTGVFTDALTKLDFRRDTMLAPVRRGRGPSTVTPEVAAGPAGGPEMFGGGALAESQGTPLAGTPAHRAVSGSAGQSPVLSPEPGPSGAAAAAAAGRPKTSAAGAAASPDGLAGLALASDAKTVPPSTGTARAGDAGTTPREGGEPGKLASAVRVRQYARAASFRARSRGRAEAEAAGRSGWCQCWSRCRRPPPGLSPDAWYFPAEYRRAAAHFMEKGIDRLKKGDSEDPTRASGPYATALAREMNARIAMKRQLLGETEYRELVRRRVQESVQALVRDTWNQVASGVDAMKQRRSSGMSGGTGMLASRTDAVGTDSEFSADDDDAQPPGFGTRVRAAAGGDGGSEAIAVRAERRAAPES